MLDSFAFLLMIATLLGFLSGLGIGGGSLLILWLTLAVEMPQNLAATINLMFFIPSALIACAFRLHQGSLDFRYILPGIIGGIAGALLFTWIGRSLDTDVLRKPFGLLLLATGVKELCYRPRNAK